MADAVVEQRDAETLAAVGGCDAELGDVGDVGGYARAEEHADQCAVAPVAENPGGIGIEDAAAGEADDVVEEAEGAVEGAVLIVNAGIDVVEVGLVDEFGGSLVVIGGPLCEFDGGREICDGGGVAGWREIVLHEEAGIHGEAGGEEGLVDGAGVVEEELGFDALDAGGVVKELEELMEERLRDVQHLRGVVGDGEGVTDDGFLGFVDAEGEAADAAAVERDEAGQDAGVEVLEEELGGALVVPAETLLPDARLGFEQRAELTRGEVAEVQDLELGRDCHALGRYSF